MTDKDTPVECKRPPLGWRCTRGQGHDGPCAVSPVPVGTSAPTCTRCGGNGYVVVGKLASSNGGDVTGNCPNCVPPAAPTSETADPGIDARFLRHVAALEEEFGGPLFNDAYRARLNGIADSLCAASPAPADTRWYCEQCKATVDVTTDATPDGDIVCKKTGHIIATFRATPAAPVDDSPRLNLRGLTLPGTTEPTRAVAESATPAEDRQP